MHTKKITISNSSSNQSNTEACITNPEKVWEIIEQYIDTVNAAIYFDGGVFYPVCTDLKWREEPGFPDITTVLKIMNNPHGAQEINNKAKAAVKKYLRKYSLNDAFHHIKARYGFKILREAKEYIPTDEFSRLLRATWETSDFYFYEEDDFSNDDLWELLQSCDPQKFMTSEEWEQFQQSVSLPETLFRGEESPDSFIWTDIDSLGELLRTGDEQFGEVYYYRGYTAHVHSEDIFAIVLGDSCTGYIVNPDKLEDVEDKDDLRMYCDRDERPEECWEDDD